MEKNIHTNAILRLQKHRWRKRQIRTATRNSRYRSGEFRQETIPGTGEEGAAVFAYAGDRYEECYREKLEEPAYGKDPARVFFSVSVNLCGHPKESEVVFEIRNTAGMIMDTTVL